MITNFSFQVQGRDKESINKEIDTEVAKYFGDLQQNSRSYEVTVHKTAANLYSANVIVRIRDAN